MDTTREDTSHTTIVGLDKGGNIMSKNASNTSCRLSNNLLALTFRTDHDVCIATVRSSRSRAIRAHYLNLAAYWRFVAYSMPCNPDGVYAATHTISRGMTGQLP